MNNFLKQINKRNLLWLPLLIILTIIPLRDLLRPGLFVGHDTADHVARIANFYQNLKDGKPIPRWAPNLNWGYGHPILMFLYPLPSYIASFLHLLGFSLVDSTKIVFGIGFVLSGITMYLWIGELFGEKSPKISASMQAGFVGGLLYMFAPYRFVDLYVRGAIGENFFFIWPPLVLYFLTKLVREQKWKYVIGGSLSLAGMLLSHNALSLMFLPFIVAYAFIIVLNSAKKLLVACYLLLVTVLGFSLSAFFWLPAFFEGKYTLRDIVTGNEIFSRFETFRRLLYSSWNYGGTGQFSVQVGIIQWAMIVLAPIIIYLLWRKYKKKLPVAYYLLLVTACIFFWMAIFLILPISKPVYQTFTILQKFQFPWRWLSLAIFPPAIIGAVTLVLIPKRYRLLLVACYLLLVTFLNRNYWHAKGYSYKPDSYYTGVYYGTTDTGESAPIWSVRFMLKQPKDYIEVIGGKADIRKILRKSTEHIYKINVKSDKARLLENTLYFPGWFVYIDGVRVSLYELNWQDPAYRGLITFYIPQGEHIVKIAFRETKLRLFADIISVGSALFLILACTAKSLQVWRFFRRRTRILWQFTNRVNS